LIPDLSFLEESSICNHSLSGGNLPFIKSCEFIALKFCSAVLINRSSLILELCRFPFYNYRDYRSPGVKRLTYVRNLFMNTQIMMQQCQLYAANFVAICNLSLKTLNYAFQTNLFLKCIYTCNIFQCMNASFISSIVYRVIF
jgi:hypothetical protein